MAYNNSWMPKTVAPSGNQMIVAVGRRVYVNLPSTGAVSGDFVPFGEKANSLPGRVPVDGEQVEIIAWRPMAPEGLSYQVQRASDRCEWWTRATNLRKSATGSVN